MSRPLTLQQAVNLTWDTRQALRLVGLSSPMFSKYLTDGLLKMSHNPEPGDARRFSFRDLFHMAVFMDMQRIGLLSVRCIGQATFMPGFNSEPPGVLVVWQGPARPGCAYDMANPTLHGHVFKLSELPDVMNDPDKRTMVAINLAHVEARLLLALGKIEGTPTEPAAPPSKPPGRPSTKIDPDAVYARFNKAKGAASA